MSDQGSNPELVQDQQGMVDFYMSRLETLVDHPSAASDPGLEPLVNQVKNHLRHVTYDFRVASDSEDFPYDLRRTEAYPEGPTDIAIVKAERLMNLLNDDGRDVLASIPDLDESYKLYADKEQQKVVNALLLDPLGIYEEFAERRRIGGPEANFPELGATLKSLWYDVLKKPEVDEACQKSQVLARLRERLGNQMQVRIDDEDFGYHSTLLDIEDAVAFFDVVTRVNDPDTPALYHSARFEYNWHSLSEDPDLTVLPTMASVTPEDLLKARSVPVAIVGVSTDTLTVDGFPQSPYEFFHHDVDHTRRMHEATMAGVEREGVSLQKFVEDSTDLLQSVLLPAIDVEGIEDGEDRDRRIAMRMIIFEIQHEDGLDTNRDTIAEAILRQPMERTPFERLVDDKTVEHFMAPRATTLAHVYRKLAHDFYDIPDRRSSRLGTDYARTRTSIARAAADLYQLVSDDPIEYEDLLTTCTNIVSTDEGFTDGFIGNIAHDIERRGKGSMTLSLMIARPLGVAAAVRRIRRHDKRVVSLFGYSALEYQDPEGLERAVRQDLAEEDPSQTIIAIGATPYGIGRMYQVAKELGFYTLGIVASKALGENEVCAEGVDEVVLVKDNGWGGSRYETGTSGLLSPTTRVFVGASDEIKAYGGGEITAVTLEEMHRREKPSSFRAFEMNHQIADIMNGQRGDSDDVDYAGPANAKWQALRAN